MHLIIIYACQRLFAILFSNNNNNNPAERQQTAESSEPYRTVLPAPPRCTQLIKAPSGVTFLQVLMESTVNPPPFLGSLPGPRLESSKTRLSQPWNLPVLLSHILPVHRDPSNHLLKLLHLSFFPQSPSSSRAPHTLL